MFEVYVQRITALLTQCEAYIKQRMHPMQDRMKKLKMPATFNNLIYFICLQA